MFSKIFEHSVTRLRFEGIGTSTSRFLTEFNELLPSKWILLVLFSLAEAEGLGVAGRMCFIAGSNSSGESKLFCIAAALWLAALF